MTHSASIQAAAREILPAEHALIAPGDYNRNDMNCRKLSGTSNQRGISIGEILILIMLVSILAIIIVPRYLAVNRDAKYEACSTNVSNIDSLVQLFYLKEGTWPQGNLSDIGTNTTYFPEGSLPVCPVTTGAKYILAAPWRRVQGHARNAPVHP